MIKCICDKHWCYVSVAMNWLWNNSLIKERTKVICIISSLRHPCLQLCHLCSLQGSWTRWPSKVPCSSKYSMNLFINLVYVTCSSKATTALPRKRSNAYFIRGVTRLGPKWQRHFRGEDDKMIAAYKGFLGESSSLISDFWWRKF